MAGKMSEVLFFSNQTEFIDWLDIHHQTASEIWVVFLKKKTNKASLTWSESVDCHCHLVGLMGYEKQLMKIAIKFALLHVSLIAFGVKLMCKRYIN